MHTCESEQATGTVLVDRLTGFIALFAMALVTLPFSGGLLPRETAAFIGLLAGGGVCVGALLLFTPVAVIALLAPVSIAGPGMREGIYVTLFGQVGLTAAQATVLSLGAYSLDAFVGLLGGGLYFVAGVLGMRKVRE